ncbi:hypothetical protein SAMN05216476_4893 [Pseudomonas mediterranea]|uniref:Uncharacterized protein n=1 Tax=Pseudomonas mediterranea TaxID=183795 RepID=A0AAX2DHP1_9PSED|nr:hypothetical protein SAMN05216476_4893 [Pseudomonas mediterranea]
MDGRPPAFPYPSSAAVGPVGRLTPVFAPSLSALPSELAFWALWHCRHARPPDVRISC